MHIPEILLLLFSFSSPPCLNVHVSVSSFIMGAECSSSQMSSPVAEWEGKHRVGGGGREKREMCVRTACVCVERDGGATAGGLGVGRTKAV